MPVRPPLTTCTACGTTCDDIRLHLDAAGSIDRAERACEIGERWFAEPVSVGPLAEVDGDAATLETAVVRIAEILAAARHPLVAGFQHATTEAIRAGVHLADRLGACFDWTASPADAASTVAMQTSGGVAATWGEIAQRSDVVVLWGSDLATTHPRHFERYTLQPTSRWLPNGRKDRTLIVVDDRDTQSLAQADVAIKVAPDAEYESLAVLRAVVAGVELDPREVKLQTGVELRAWHQLAQRMHGARYGAVVYGKRFAAAGPEPIVQLTQLMAELTAHTRWVALGEGGPGNAAGAANVLAWQSGFPLGVSFAHRYPRYGPDEYTTDTLLARGEVDALLLVADDLADKLSPRAAARLSALPTIAIDWRDTQSLRTASARIRVARPAVECGGTTYRVDGLVVPMRSVRATDRPTAEAVLQQIAAAVEKRPA